MFNVSGVSSYCKKEIRRSYCTEQREGSGESCEKHVAVKMKEKDVILFIRKMFAC